MPFLPPYLLIDDFLPPALHRDLLDHALRQESAFSRAEVRRDGAAVYGDNRKAWKTEALGAFKAPLGQAIEQVLPALFAELGITPFEPARIELELTAHRDGDFFGPHIDTFHGTNRENLASDRVITAVYYFHAQPKGFTGGEFAIHPLGGGEAVPIEPRDNRLLALPAFAPHEVRPISCPDDHFRSARFAVNIWVHRAKQAPASP